MMAFSFSKNVLGALHNGIIWRQINQSQDDVVLCRALNGSYVERSVMELSVYGVEHIAHVYPDAVHENYVAMNGSGFLITYVDTLPETPLENLAAGFLIRLEYFPEWSLR